MRDIAGRRRALALGLTAIASPLALAAAPAAAQAPGLPEGRGKTYVLAHGSWSGGWFWAPVAERLRAQGHRVFTPTYTGMGERRHLLSRDITLDTFITDLTNVVEAEELRDVILVGHSFAGVTITGVADRMPERIRRLVYFDAAIVQDGQSFYGTLSPEAAAARRRAAQEAGGGVAVPPPPASGITAAFGVSDGPVLQWLVRRNTPHPLATYETPLRLKNPIGNGRPRTYLACTNPPFPANEPTRRWVRGQQGWEWVELAAGHLAAVTHPEETARLLAGIG